MKVVKWLDEHFEESLLIALLVVISCVELLQVIARNVPFIQSLTWAEELCRFAWIATVFLSLGFTLRTDTALKVTALIDVLPAKFYTVMRVLIDCFTGIVLAVLSYNAAIVLGRIVASGEVSPAMQWPMWIMYAIVLVGFILGTVRSLQMAVIHFKSGKKFAPPPRILVKMR